MTSDQVSKLSGASLRQLQWWHEQGLVRPEIVKHERVWSTDDANTVLLLCDLRERGVSLQTCRKALKGFAALGGAEWLVMTAKGRPRFVLTAGEAIRAAAAAGVAVVVVQIRRSEAMVIPPAIVRKSKAGRRPVVRVEKTYGVAAAYARMFRQA